MFVALIPVSREEKKTGFDYIFSSQEISRCENPRGSPCIQDYIYGPAIPYRAITIGGGGGVESPSRRVVHTAADVF